MNVNFSRLYSAGPRGFTWSGVCEVDATGRKYRHHHDWPRTSDYWTSIDGELSFLVREKYWVHVEVHPLLQLPIGA